MIDLENLKRPPHEFPSYDYRSFGTLVGCVSCGFRFPHQVKTGATTMSMFSDIEDDGDPVECPACKSTFDAAENIFRFDA